MEVKVTVLNQHCFVCGEKLDANKTSVLESLSRSDKQIYKYLETFLGENLEELVMSPNVEAEVCVECLDQFENYDQICLQAARIQEDIANCFKDNQLRIQDDQSDFLKCNFCLAQFSNYDELDTHECDIDNADYYETVEYTEDSSLEGTVEVALPNESPPKFESFNYTCNTCGDQFERKRDYQTHKKQVHLPENAEIFHCSQCNDGFFASENELKLHVVVSHPSDPTSSSYVCPICSKAFTTKALLNRHFGIHSAHSERPHICEICGKTYFHYSSFRAHIKIHTDIRDYACTQCEKTFRSQSHLNRHLKIHTKRKDHECEKCGTRFAERYNLTAHMKTHIGISRKRRLT